VAAALANASGGQIIYGMTEDNHQCSGLDEGVDPSKFNGLWFEQVIQQNVRPTIEGLRIHPVPLGNGNNAYVITIPAAQSRAPHQLTRDFIYYRRRNFRNDKMEDYEIREAFNRSQTRELDVMPAFKSGTSADHSLVHSSHGGRSGGIEIEFIVSNQSKKPAEYAILLVLLDIEVQILGAFNLNTEGLQTSPTASLQRLAGNLGFPQSPPLFQEHPESGGTVTISLTEPNQFREYQLVTEVRTPGFTQKKSWVLLQQPSHLYLRPAGGRAP
jgi:hypothetical protein